jgi:ATP-dependent exoDNAse (exonuclease V) beta subunit
MRIENILAITFTNKAVPDESRIAGSLSICQRTTFSKAADLMQDLSTDLTLSIIQIKAKSRQIGIKHIIHNYAARYFYH